MDIHNTEEDTVIARVDEIFKSINESGNTGKICTCGQCRTDVICYVLNRVPPRYIVSNRGASRARTEGIDRQQRIADIAALVHEGLNRVNHNQRPYFSHSAAEEAAIRDSDSPVFNIPAIMGRLLNGNNFAPISDVNIELLLNGALVPVRDKNWQNPFHLVFNTDGNFSFWPAPIKAFSANERQTFGYTLRVSSPEFETLIHFFTIPVVSEIQAASSFTLERTFKLQDLYMFPPGENNKNRCLI